MQPTTAELQTIKQEASQWARTRLSDLNTVILDTETTGLPSKDPDTEIVQLAITDVKGRPLFCMLLKPMKPMTDEVIGIHGITNEQVFHQPVFAQVAKMISFVLEGKHVVCYNAGFDVKLLWSLFKKNSLPVPNVSGVSCAMEYYSNWKGEWNDKKGGVRWQRLPALGYGAAHDALVDCLSTLKVLELMAGEVDPAAVTAEEISLDF